MDKLKTIACAAIDKEVERLYDLSNEIWNYKELSFEEHLSHATLTQVLVDRGFHVDRHYKLPTAFAARWGSCEGKDGGRKPHIAVICEYDALPEIGHACGHNLIAELGVAAGIGIKAAMEESGVELGKLTVLGTPAEEGGGGKIELMKAGVFDDVDVAMMAHPAPFWDARPIFLGSKRLVVTYKGRASHAAGFPWEGINALDGAVLGYMNIAALRQQLKPLWRVHSIITKGGTKFNVIPEEAELMIQVRAPNDTEVDQVFNKVKHCLLASATASGCTVDIKELPKPYECMVNNESLAKLYESNAGLVGVEIPSPYPRQILGSTDMGNLSHKVPSIHPLYTCGTEEAFNHTRDFTTAVGSPNAQAATLAQGKILAMVALDIFNNPQLLDGIRQDFEYDMKHL